MEIISFFFHSLLKIGSLLASWATVAGVVMIFIAYMTLRRNTSIKRMELISKIYDRFLNDELYGFYIRVRRQQTINWQHDEKDERLLNKSLTLFDEVNYLQNQKLLDEKAWEYVACEIQNFAFNENVWDYMIQRTQDCKDRGFPDDIIPFTGFPELLNKVPLKFRANPFPRVPDRCNALFRPSASSQSSS